jgi:anaerobic magnesium-protoporphyrin IX monomethyl ester cyclase
MTTLAFVDLWNLFNDHHGIYSISAVLKARGFNVHYISTRTFGRALRWLSDIRPDVVLYSAFSANMHVYVSFDKRLKQHLSPLSVIGGSGPTYDTPSLRGSTIDAICAGEGEVALLRFLEEGYQYDKNIFRSCDEFPNDFHPLVDVNALPFPDRSSVYDFDHLLRDAPTKQFLSGRGCPYDCTYCFNHRFRQLFGGYGPVIRKKSVDYLLEEIRRVRHQYPLEDIGFNDDTFIIDKAWFCSFADRYPREIGLPYTCNVRANLMDDDIAEGLHRSGCRGVNWSIEAGNENVRNVVLKRAMSDEQMIRAAETLRRHKVLFRTGNMIGLPGETIAQMWETVDLNIRVRPAFAFVNIFVPYPGLRLTQYAVDHGCCSPLSSHDLPKDYFSGTVMRMPERDRALVYKIFCLFTSLVLWPGLYQSKRLLHALLSLPACLLRLWYEGVYTWKIAGFYTPRARWRHRVLMGLRYLRNR